MDDPLLAGTLQMLDHRISTVPQARTVGMSSRLPHGIGGVWQRCIIDTLQATHCFLAWLHDSSFLGLVVVTANPWASNSMLQSVTHATFSALVCVTLATKARNQYSTIEHQGSLLEHLIRVLPKRLAVARLTGIES